MTLLLWVLVGIAAILLGGVLFQLAGTAIDRRLHRPPGRLLKIGGTRLHVCEEGAGEATIVLESGIAASSLNWRALQRELAKVSRVVSYDRAGFGWSGPPLTSRTVENVTCEFEELLAEIAGSAPILLVAHSFGSLIVREFARRHPRCVLGIVLLDPIDCEHWRNLSAKESQRLALGTRFARRGALLARLGIVRAALLLVILGARALPRGIARATSGPGAVLISRIAEEVGKMPRELWPAVRSHWSRPESFETMAAYLAQLTQCVNEVPYRSLNDIPLVVISAEKATSSELDEHRRLAALSARGEHIIARRSGHWVQLDRPDLVVNVVRRLLAK
jgi:pimeloyl-ACP methyl ester carboxylesterase